ncbi:ProQ/FINO family protein [Rhizobium sp. BK176]|uniref:ProQ/FINO family protein n=1 Tax=Rhizobium sp. BK176 TaxID=2587071 RepID=UPI00386E3BBE
MGSCCRSDGPSKSGEYFILATACEVSRAEAITALLSRPIAILPTRVGEPILPFSVGLFSRIRALKRPECLLSSLRTAIAIYIYSPRYYLALSQPNSLRFGLDARPTDKVSRHHRKVAGEAYRTSCRIGLLDNEH